MKRREFIKLTAGVAVAAVLPWRSGYWVSTNVLPEFENAHNAHPVKDLKIGDYRAHPIVTLNHDPSRVIGRARNVALRNGRIEFDVEWLKGVPRVIREGDWSYGFMSESEQLYELSVCTSKSMCASGRI